jgi:peptidoglycan hydrolase-like protein with peptidoglycan-binding domain
MTETGGVPTRLLRRGSTGDDVAWLQRALVAAGFHPGRVDGIFGAHTESAVEQFQSALGLVTDGLAGSHTIAVLAAAARTEEPGENANRWSAISGEGRMRHAMQRLVDHYGYPVPGAAGLVGNLWAESGVIPSRIEGSRPEAPMRARDFHGNVVDFTAEQVMNRNRTAGRGPLRPGVGLAQWTSPGRRAGLFAHSYNGVPLGADVLFNMDAQLDYLDHELRTAYRRVHNVLTADDVTVDDATDEVLYNFEIPGAILDGGTKLPRSDARVHAVFRSRRDYAHRALRAYQGNTP